MMIMLTPLFLLPLYNDWAGPGCYVSVYVTWFLFAQFFSYGRIKEIMDIGDHTQSALPFLVAGGAVGVTIR